MFPPGQLPSASLLLYFCLGLIQKTIPLIQCQGRVSWAAAWFLTSVSSDSFCLKCSFSPRGKQASQKCQKLWRSAGPLCSQLAQSPRLKKLVHHLQMFCWPEENLVQKAHLLFRRKELCSKGFQAVTVKIPLLTEQANVHPKPIIFQVWCDLWGCLEIWFSAWIARSYKVNTFES